MSSRVSQYVEKLVQYVLSLHEFVIYPDFDGHYNHIGATIADAVLQANGATYVKSHVSRILINYPQARTTTSILALMEVIDATEYLSWDGLERANCFHRVLQLFAEEEIESESDLNRWLSDDASLWKLRSVRGVGPKVVDYLRLLVGASSSDIDRYLLNFIELAGVSPCCDEEAMAVLDAASVSLSIKRASFDYSVWQFMNRREADNGEAKVQLLVRGKLNVAAPDDLKNPINEGRAGSIAFVLVMIAGGVFLLMIAGNQPGENYMPQKSTKVARQPEKLELHTQPGAKTEDAKIPDAIMAELAAGSLKSSQKSALWNRNIAHKKSSVEVVNTDAGEDQYFAPDDYDQEHAVTRPHQELAKLLRDARVGSAAAQRVLASYYEHGYLVSKCEEKAAYWYRTASLGGDGIAAEWLRKQERLNLMHHSPECAGPSCDILFKRAGMQVSIGMERGLIAMQTENPLSPGAPDRALRSDRTMAMLRNTLDEHAL